MPTKSNLKLMRERKSDRGIEKNQIDEDKATQLPVK